MTVNIIINRISHTTLVSIMVARDHQYIKLTEILNQDLEHNQENSINVTTQKNKESTTYVIGLIIGKKTHGDHNRCHQKKITEDKMIIGQKNREKKHAIVIVQEKIEEVRVNHSNKYPELIDNKVPRDSQRCIDSKSSETDRDMSKTNSTETA